MAKPISAIVRDFLGRNGASETPSQRELLRYYASRCNARNQFNPGLDLIMSDTKLSRASITNANQYFKGLGILDWKKGHNTGGGKGLSNLYTINRARLESGLNSTESLLVFSTDSKESLLNSGESLLNGEGVTANPEIVTAKSEGVTANENRATPDESSTSVSKYKQEEQANTEEQAKEKNKQEEQAVPSEVERAVVSLSPVPTGDSHDELLDTCILGLDRHPRAKMHHDTNYMRHELVRDCIDKGTLRDIASWRDAINKVQAKIERDIRLGKRPERWLDGQWRQSDLWDLGEMFGVPRFVSKYKPPTPEELEKTRQRDIQHQAELVKAEKEEKLKIRVRKATRMLAETLYPCPDFSVDEENLPPEYHEWRANVDGFKTAFKKNIEARLRETEESDDELKAWFQEMANA